MKTTRQSLMDWALAGATTDQLRRLKAGQENVCQMASRLRQEKQGVEFELERLQAAHEGLLVGHRRWREEAVMLHQRVSLLASTWRGYARRKMKRVRKQGPKDQRTALKDCVQAGVYALCASYLEEAWQANTELSSGGTADKRQQTEQAARRLLKCSLAMTCNLCGSEIADVNHHDMMDCICSLRKRIQELEIQLKRITDAGLMPQHLPATRYVGPVTMPVADTSKKSIYG